MERSDEQGIYRLTMNHSSMSDKGVFNPTSLEEVNLSLDRIEQDETARAVFITGVEKNFSQGLDLEYLMTIPTEDFQQFVENTMVMISRILTFPIPVVGVINGHAFGLGAMIALACDFKVMHENRGFLCLPEINLGMPFTPAMASLVTHTLSGRLRRDMMLTGYRLGGEEGVKRGLFDACGPMDKLISLAEQAVEPALDKKKQAYAAIKKDLNRPVIEIVANGTGLRK